MHIPSLVFVVFAVYVTVARPFSHAEEVVFLPDWNAGADPQKGLALFHPPSGLQSRVESTETEDRLRVTRDGNVLFEVGNLRVHPGQPGREPAVTAGPAFWQRLQLSPQGSGSVSLLRNEYKLVRGGFPLDKQAKTWWTVGVDSSQPETYEGLWVIVCGHYGFGQRSIELPLHIPGILNAPVQIDKGRFRVILPESGLILQGTVLFPDSPRIDPRREGDSTHLRIWAAAPDEGNTFTWSEPKPDDALDLDETPEPEESEIPVDPNESTPERTRRLIRAVTTDTSMGSPTLRQRVNQHLVLVLTLGKEEPPDLRFDGQREQELFSIGDQQVRYWEFLVEFEKGMRDVLQNRQGRKGP
jgi:hypothetical protein